MKMMLVFAVIILFLCPVFLPEYGLALDKGDCIECHVKLSRAEISPEQPFAEDMTTRLCVDCHSNIYGDTIKLVGGVRVPVVFNTVKPLSPLAGGNFYYVAFIDDARGHNVNGIVSPDPRFAGLPPGYERDSDPSLLGYKSGRPLNCAGSNGCHGNRNVVDQFDAVLRSHHSGGKPNDGSTTARSYRYLKNTDIVPGVTGFEVEDWGQNSTPARHNEYTVTINILCMNCHSAFVGPEPPETDTGMGIREPRKNHPVGVVIPDSGEFLHYNPDILPLSDRTDRRPYSLEAPVARPEFYEAPNAEVVLGEDLVMCLSCHMAHGSPYRHSLRWDYDSIVAGAKRSGGCFICHPQKGIAPEEDTE